ncbi:MAG: ABC transporter substrate-binding protein [Oscillospiraceae bacterium]|nr:ABC transporter substrate-binding protein [Oscillospiraceae bacterium]
MKRLLAFALCLVLVLTAVPVQASAEPVTINVYNWGQYISDGTDGYIDVNKAFTEATGIKVNYMTFDSNETMYTKLKTGGSTYDVIIPSDYMVARLIAEDMLLELDFSNIPNYKLVDEAYKNTAFDPDNKYTVPYTWGTVGLIYNKKYVDEADLGSWDLLWNTKYSGKILMFDNPRDAFAISEQLLGIDINTEDPDELRSAAYKLIEQKPLVQSYVMDQIYDKMEREEAWIAPYYAGDYLQMVQENENLSFFFPNEGFNLFIDAMCIPKSCQNKAAAEAYINFLCGAEVSGENLDYLGYSTPISAAKEFMDPDIVESDIAYPSAETLEKGSAFSYLDEQTNQLMDSLWLEVKTQGSVDTYAIVCMGVVTAGLVLYFIIHGIRKKKRIENRCKKWKTE